MDNTRVLIHKKILNFNFFLILVHLGKIESSAAIKNAERIRILFCGRCRCINLLDEESRKGAWRE